MEAQKRLTLEGKFQFLNFIPNINQQLVHLGLTAF